MAKINVPSGVIEGFIAIASLDQYQIDELGNYLKNLPVGTKFEKIDDYIGSSLKALNSQKIVQSIISFSELLEPENVKFEELARDLATSAQANHSELLSNVDIDKLESNLLIIFQNSRNLKLTLKAFSLSTENSDLYVTGKIITDIRLIFNDNITESKRSGVILHKLHLTVQNDGRRNDLFVTMDGSDLKKLKENIDRAILKEDIIKEDYENINFISY